MTIIFYTLLAATLQTMHSCVHDDSFHQVIDAQTHPYPGRRNLVGGLRIQFKYVPEWNATLSTDTLLKSISNFVAVFVQKTFEVQQEMISTSLTNCNGVIIPLADRGVLFDKDLIVFTQTFQTGSFVAQAGACQGRSIAPRRPTIGAAIWNKAQINQFQLAKSFGFQKYMRVWLHEMIHILGFTSSQYSRYSISPVYQIINSIYYIITPNVKLQVARYYGCNTSGMPIQQGLSSHWEEDVILDQLLTPIYTSPDYCFLSNFTLNLLWDSGFYTKVNFNYSQSSSMTFGRNKGCAFVLSRNCSDTNFFCQTLNVMLPLYYRSGYGVCSFNIYAGCYVPSSAFNWTCMNPLTTKQFLTYEVIGDTSKVFQSNITIIGIPPSIPFICYPSFCENGGLKVQVNLVNYTCSDGLTIKIGNGYVKCPPVISTFCATKFPCQSSCGMSGMCIAGSCISS